MWIYAFKSKKLWGNVCLQPWWQVSISLHFFTPTCKFPFIRRISLQTKMLPLISLQMLAFLGTVFIIYYFVSGCFKLCFRLHFNLWKFKKRIWKIKQSLSSHYMSSNQNHWQGSEQIGITSGNFSSQNPELTDSRKMFQWQRVVRSRLYSQ